MSDPAPQASPAKRALMAIPLVISVLALGVALYLAFLAPKERAATGARATLRFQTACPAEAGAVILKRAAAIGLGEPALRTTADGLELDATLPGLPDDRTAIPALLARPGKLELRVGDTIVATEADLGAGVELNMDLKGEPYAAIPLMAGAGKRFAAASGPVKMTLDGELLLDEPGNAPLKDDRLRASPQGKDNAEKMRRAADWGIVLDSGPLPCPVVVPLPGG